MAADHVMDDAWSQPTPRLAQRLCRALAIDLMIVALALPLGELAVRTFAPGTSRFIFSDTVTGGHPVRLNSFHFRDAEFPQRKPPDERRIVCVGDSTTFGAGLPVEATYPKQLEQLLNARAGSTHWLVINTGSQGNSLSGVQQVLEHQGLALEPSVVVLGFSASIVSETGAQAPSASGRAQRHASLIERLSRNLRQQLLNLHAQLHQSYLYVWCDLQLRRRLYRWGVIRDRMDQRNGAIFAYGFDAPGVQLMEAEEAYRNFEEEFAALNTWLDRQGIPLIVLGIPSRFLISDLPVDNERGFDLAAARINPMDRMAGLCERRGVPFVDLRVTLRQAREAMLAHQQPWDDLYTPTDYAHLNEHGMALAARELLQRLRRERLIVDAK